MGRGDANNRIGPFSFWMGPTSEGLMTKQTRQQSRDECAAKKLKLNSDDSCFSALASAGELAIQLRPIVSLTPHRRNARTHSRKQIQQIARSIETFGFTNPVLIDAAGGILAGHGRVEAAKLLGLAEVPAIELAALNEEQRRAYAITDNRLGELAGWDRDLLRLELGELSVAFPELDLTLTGFETGELDIILLADASGSIASDPRADELPHAGPIPVTRPGDLWLMGPHRLLCSDARDPDAYRILLPNQRVHLALTDPPFNVAIDGHARGLGQHHHRDFAMASGEMTETEYITFLKIVFRNMADVSIPGAVHFTFMDWRHFHEILSAGRDIYAALLNVCVWAKGNGGMGSLYRSEHEHVFVWRVSNNAHTNNIQLGSFGRNRTNVWRYPGANSFGPGRAEMLELHPTVKPTQLLVDAILDVSKRGEWVLDPLVGSGSTLIAAHQIDRICGAIEFDPRYCDVAVQRFERLTGIEARHAGTGTTFSKERSVRNAEAKGSNVCADLPSPEQTS
jgi:DNA modification methylase